MLRKAALTFFCFSGISVLSAQEVRKCGRNETLVFQTSFLNFLPAPFA